MILGKSPHWALEPEASPGIEILKVTLDQKGFVFMKQRYQVQNEELNFLSLLNNSHVHSRTVSSYSYFLLILFFYFS